MANDWYNCHTLKGIYNLYDFSADQKLRKKAGNFLTLYYARWAQEQIDGVRGGGIFSVKIVLCNVLTWNSLGRIRH